MADGQQPMTDSETEERLRYWEARIRAGQERGRELDEAQRAAWSPESPAGTFPETPDSLKNGNVDGPSVPQNAGLLSDLHFQPAPQRGNVAQDEAQQEVEDEIARLRRHRRGNVPHAPNYAPGAIDDFGRGRLVTLLAMGLSIRQAAAAVGVSHTAVRLEIRRNPELLVQVELARQHARLEPLLVIIRESKRSWRAASWLMKYLNGTKRKGKKRAKREG